MDVDFYPEQGDIQRVWNLRKLSRVVLHAIGTHNRVITHILAVSNPYIQGLKPACFMVLGSKGTCIRDSILPFYFCIPI